MAVFSMLCRAHSWEEAGAVLTPAPRHHTRKARMLKTPVEQANTRQATIKKPSHRRGGGVIHGILHLLR